MVLGGKYEEGDEGPVIETEMDSCGVWRHVPRGDEGPVLDRDGQC